MSQTTQASIPTEETTNQQEKEFSYTFQHVGTIGKTGQAGDGNDQLDRPLDVVITQSRYLIIADSTNNRLQIFNADSREYFTTIKTDITPKCLVLHDDDTLWVLHEGDKVWKFSNISQVISNAKDGIDTKPELFEFSQVHPKQVLFQFRCTNDKLGERTIISECYEHELEIYDKSMSIIFKYAADKGAGQENDRFYYPTGSCFDYKNGYFLVCDTANHRCQIFE